MYDTMKMKHPYPIGTRVYKEFPSYGWFWGTITSNFRLKTKSSDDSGEFYEYYYDVRYTDGDGETFDQNEIEEFLKYAIDEEKKERNQSKKESLNIKVPDTSRSTSTTATTTNTTRSTGTGTTSTSSSSPQETDDSDAEINMEDDSSSNESSLDADYYCSEEDRRKRPKRRASTRRNADAIDRKRPRRSVSYNGRYNLDDDDDDDDDDLDEDIDSDADADTEIEDDHDENNDENDDQSDDNVLADSREIPSTRKAPRRQILLHECPTTSSKTTSNKIMDEVGKLIRQTKYPDTRTCQTYGCKRVRISKGYCQKCFCHLSKVQMKTNFCKQQFDAIVRPENFYYKPTNLESETTDICVSAEIDHLPPPLEFNPLKDVTSTKRKALPSKPQLGPLLQPTMQPNIVELLGVTDNSLPQKDGVPGHVFQHVFKSYLAEVIATTETGTKKRNIAGRIFWQNQHPLLKAMSYYHKLRNLVYSRRKSKSSLMYWQNPVPCCEGLNSDSIMQPKNFDHNPSDHYVENRASETADICVSAEIDNHAPPSEVNLLNDVTSTKSQTLLSHPQLVPVLQPTLQPNVVRYLPLQDDVPPHVFQHVFRSYLLEVATTDAKQRNMAGRIFWRNQHPLMRSMPYYRRLQQQVTSRQKTKSERTFWQNQLFYCEGAFNYDSTYGFFGDYQSPFS